MPAAKRPAPAGRSSKPSDVQKTGNRWPVAVCLSRARRARTSSSRSREQATGPARRPRPRPASAGRAAVVEKGAERQLIAVARLRQDRQNAEIPEEDDQQRRNVAENFDIDVADLRISQFCDSRPMPTMKPMTEAVMMPMTATRSVLRRPTSMARLNGRIGRVRDQALADVEAGAAPQEAEAGGDVGALQVLDRVADDPPDEDDEPRKTTTWKKMPRTFGSLMNETLRPSAAPIVSCDAIRPPSSLCAGRRTIRLPASTVRSADRRSVLQAALRPQGVDAARDLQRASRRRCCARRSRRSCRRP